MNNSTAMAPLLTFQDTELDVIDRSGNTWLKAADIARALGYKKADAVTQIYDRNSDEFTSAMSQTLNLSVPQNGGELTRESRIFSLRGAHLIAMFARTEIAKEFRKWVLDILDKETKPSLGLASDNANQILSEVSAHVAQRLMSARLCLSFDQNGMMRLTEIPADARIMTDSQLAGLIGDSGSGIKRTFLPEIIVAAASRLGR